MNQKQRSELIEQLRQALYLCESPQETEIEFDILETTFTIEFENLKRVTKNDKRQEKSNGRKSKKIINHGRKKRRK